MKTETDEMKILTTMAGDFLIEYNIYRQRVTRII